MLGQTDPVVDKRGLIENAAEFRNARVAEPWTRYDTVVIGQGAQDVDRGWFNTWADFANASKISWFVGRSSGVGDSYCNTPDARTDFAQDIYQTNVEFLCPPGLGEFGQDVLDQGLAQLFFTYQLPTEMPLRTKLAGTDEVSLLPANHMPSGFGVAGTVVDGAAAPTVLPGSQGTPHVTNNWAWPDPILLAAKSLISVEAVLDRQSRGLFAALPGPGVINVPTGEGTFYQYPCWYKIRISMRGPRYVQLRGARSSR
jgi:hypothetical protein